MKGRYLLPVGRMTSFRLTTSSELLANIVDTDDKQLWCSLLDVDTQRVGISL